MAKELITRQEAAEYMKVCLSTADKIINNTNFDGKMKVGRRVLIDKKKLDTFLEEFII